MSDSNIEAHALPWTGERYLPEVHGGVELEHLHRYLFASQLLSGKTVLDIASGEGYGSAMLARTAAHVTGVDISTEAILHATEKYKADNLEFRLGSCASIPLADSSIDVVVSFETIEHHDEHEAMMLEIKRVLKPDGVLVISSPDKLEYSDKPSYNNEYHVKELYRDEFEVLLDAYFKSHSIFGQRIAYGSLIIQENEACLSETYKMADKCLEVTTGLANAIYLIAIATDVAIPSVKVGLLDQGILESSEITERDEAIRVLSETVESLIIDRDGQKDALEKLIHERTHLNQMVAHLNQMVIDGVAQLNNVIAEYDSLVAQLNAKYNAQVAQLNAKYNAQVEQLNQTVAERVAQLEEFRTQLTAVYKSTSWRLTSPLRWLVRKIHKAASIVNGEYANPEKQSNQEQQEQKDFADVPVPTTQQDESTFRILLVSHYCPSRAHAGGLRILDIYSLIRHQYPTIQIDLLTFHRPSIDWSLDDVHNIFNNVYLSPVETLAPEVLFELRGLSLRYDVIDLQFHESGNQIDAFRRIGKKIIFTPMESLVRSLALDMQTNFQFNSASSLRKAADSFKLAVEEVNFALKVDQVVCVSKTDASFLSSLCETENITFLETAVSTLEFEEIIHKPNSELNPELKEDNIIYVAYFGSETNIVALKWYLDYVHSLIKQSVPDYKLQVVGRGDLSVFDNYLSDSIEFIGEVPALIPAISSAKVGIAPALNGSGLRGKINQYAIFGVPSVVSTISAEGLIYEDGTDIYIADEPEIFADRCIRLLKDNELNKKMGKLAREKAFAHYSWESKISDIQKIYALGVI